MDIQRHARVDVADVLRGFAVMAIGILHSIEHFNFYSFADPPCEFMRFTDAAIWEGMFFAFGGKAYAIFALLFGFSFFIQDDNQRLRGKDFRLRFCWRLVLLFLWGNLNAAFFTAEVLVLFSLVGFVLVFTCRLSEKVLLWLIGICMLQPVALSFVVRAATDSSFVLPAIPTGEYWNATFKMQMEGNFWQMVRVNLWEGQLASLSWAWDNGRVFQTAGLFMLGMLAGRRNWFLREHLPLWGRILAGALIAFFPLYGLANMLPRFIENPNLLTPLSMILSSLYKLAFMLVLVSGVLFAYYSTRLQHLLQKLAPYGRMSLTNYITQSIIGAMLYYHWGFALHRYLCTTYCWLVGIAIFLLQLAFCTWWMKRHNHGPLEYLWKRATWLK